MKIAAVPRTIPVSSKTNSSSNSKTVKNSSVVKNVNKTKNSSKTSVSGKNVKKLNKKTTSSSGSSCCSECSDQVIVIPVQRLKVIRRKRKLNGRK